MTIDVTCDACFMNYQLKDELAGRKVRCKHCKSIIEVPRRGADQTQLVADPWVDDDDEPGEAPRAPAPARKKKKKKKRRKSERERPAGLGMAPLVITGGAFVGLFVLMCLVGIFWRPMWSVLGGGMALVGGGLMLIGGIGIMMAAFEEDSVCGMMYMFVPFYPLYYILTRLGDVWKLLLMHIGGGAMLGIGFVVMQAAELGGGGGGMNFDFADAQDEDSKYNLQQMGIGMLNHHDTYQRLAPAATQRSDGKVNVSWQTALLPFMDWAELYNQINPAVAWDDPANDPFNREVIDEFMQLAVEDTNDDRGYGLSHYALNQAFLGPDGGARMRDISDGTSNTVMSGEVGDGYKPWADPSNVRPLGGSLTPGPTTFGNPSGQGAYLLLADGSVRWFGSDTDPSVLNALGTIDGGEVVDF